MAFAQPLPRAYPGGLTIETGAGAAGEAGTTTIISRILGAAGAGFEVGRIIGALGGSADQPTNAPTTQQGAAGIAGTVQTPTATPVPTTATATPPPPPRGGPSKKKVAAAAVGAGAAATAVTNPGGFFGAIGDGITTTLDFLKLLAWLFHPRNILRAVEFLIGIVLMIFGLHAAMQARGERREGFTTSESALTRSELGRVATELGRSARGGGSPQRRSAPHVTRRRALAQRYTREERVRERERKGEKPAGHSKRTKGSGAGTKKTK